MSKLVAFFMFMFIGCTALSAIMEGGGGVVAVELQTTIDTDDTTIEVSTTTDFLDADTVVIGNEEIEYTGKTATTFTGCTRASNGTTAAYHQAGSTVYTRNSSLINDAIAFSIPATVDSMGYWAVIAIPFNFLTKTLPHVLVMNYSFLTGDMAFIGWIFIAISTGFVITLALSLAGGRRVG